MCLLIASPEGRKIPHKHLRVGYASNPQGAGFCYAKEGKIFIEKGFFTFDSFIKAFGKINGKYPALIHFRWATSGGTNTENCHPWEIDENHAMAHNGILWEFDKLNPQKSDTGNFVDFVFKPMFAANPTQYKENFVKYLISESIGKGNKIAILSSAGEVTIYNEESGNWSGGNWYSNYDYLPAKVTSNTGSFGVTGFRSFDAAFESDGVNYSSLQSPYDDPDWKVPTQAELDEIEHEIRVREELRARGIYDESDIL